jgi:hypothetical protein
MIRTCRSSRATLRVSERRGAGLLEDLCAPANELEFNRLIRDPAGTGKPAEPGERR